MICSGVCVRRAIVIRSSISPTMVGKGLSHWWTGLRGSGQHVSASDMGPGSRSVSVGDAMFRTVGSDQEEGTRADGGAGKARLRADEFVPLRSGRPATGRAQARRWQICELSGANPGLHVLVKILRSESQQVVAAWGCRRSRPILGSVKAGRHGGVNQTLMRHSLLVMKRVYVERTTGGGAGSGEAGADGLWSRAAVDFFRVYASSWSIGAPGVEFERRSHLRDVHRME